MVINKIAAGEVINSPVSVVKELIENSLDAMSTEIYIKCSGKGLRSIAIQDNGFGVSKENFKLLCQRHCTSKIRNYEDLVKINSMGFRGEALASIS